MEKDDLNYYLVMICNIFELFMKVLDKQKQKIY